MPARKHIYFASDFHLGIDASEPSSSREKRIVRWLDEIKKDAKGVYLMGDVFDFWFEYKTVVPRGYIRFLGKLAELSDLGIEIIFFKGNHDMWMFDYFKKELNAKIVDNELIIHDNGKSFYLHHGDGLGDGDAKYKILKKMFRSKFCQWLFARLHPNLGIGIAQLWSRKSRIANDNEEVFLGDEKEWLIKYANELSQSKDYNYYIFGHRHLAYERKLQNGSYVINLGEWFSSYTYAVWDGESLTLKKWK